MVLSYYRKEKSYNCYINLKKEVLCSVVSYAKELNMEWKIPGTALKWDRNKVDAFEPQLKSMFMLGGVLLSQVTSLTGLEGHMVQNWVKRGFLSPPENKRYSLNQLCRIININMLKNALPLEKICGLLTYINGDLDDESDDIIDDSTLYFTFLKLAAKAKSIDDEGNWQEALSETLKDYSEPYKGAKKRVEEVLKIMVIAYIASRFKTTAENMVENLNI